MEKNESFSDFDVRTCVQRMRSGGGATICNFLSNTVRNALLDELRRYDLQEQPALYGAYDTRQAFASVSSFANDSLFVSVAGQLELFLEKKFRECSPYPFSEPVRFTDLVVQRYQPGPIGIAPHRDGKSFINVVAVLILEGEARFCFCDDREGNNFRPMRNQPGDLLLMRAPGFLGEDVQPFHFVDSITQQRTTFALRQKKK
ncbi:MAG: hypothetical protein Q8R25_04045 [bacterium]|nr:hypothetical protein [bacterium]